MRVIGTAGHVDHGKSTLVERLSGIDPDRLAEEKARQMTIDLGFAWTRLPNNETVGIVDVPGHRDFIENMLAGVGGIDAALLVIAADEGIMPQTREHLAILRLLDVRQIIVVISKIDLIDEPEWIDLVQLEIEDLFAEHGLEAAAIAPLSAHTGEGVDALIASLVDVLNKAPRRVDYGAPRLPIDRVFVISGFGTVVTGTLSGGALAVGDAIELQPSGASGRIRSLQSYMQSVDSAAPGARVAANIAGVNSDRVKRGDALTLPGQLKPTALIDARLALLPDMSLPLRHNAEVKFFSGAAETIANLRLLDADELLPGDEAWAQLRLRQALPLSRGDRFILRYPSPAQTIGGGSVVDAHPRQRLKRFRAEVIEDMALRQSGTPAERLAKAAEGSEPLSLRELQKRLTFDDAGMAAAFDEALALGLARRAGKSAVWGAGSWSVFADRAFAQLSAFHRAQRLRLGMPRAELRSRLNVKLTLLDQLIDSDRRIAADGNLVRLRSHSVQFRDEEQRAVDALMSALETQPFTPPSIADMNAIAGEPVVRALLDLGELAQVSDKIAFTKTAYTEMIRQIRAHIQDYGAIDAKTLRDKYGASRKYAIAVLEHLDSLGVTRRVGDERQAGQNF